MRLVVLNERLDPSEFMGASWAKFNLPVRLGTERPAIKRGKLVAILLYSHVERTFNKQVADLEEYCQNWCGAVGEIAGVKSECQPVKRPSQVHDDVGGANVDRLQHIEVIQGAMASDSARAISSATDLRDALLESEKQSTKPKRQSGDPFTRPLGGRGAHRLWQHAAFVVAQAMEP